MKSYKHPLYNVWYNMRARCTDPEHESWDLYGGRGIRLCEEWEDYKSFYEWALPKWQKGLVLDKIDNNLNYSPTNCRFVTPTDSLRNKRNCVKITAFGESKGAREWAADERCHVTHSCVLRRIKKGWLPEDAITKPATPHHLRSAK